ncbi:hypothetical protein NPIL_652931 [Nephila pilipes]|uniref:Uncharacterized protein n=1 Tax=Nephila pilipes TaxID=299642 RepID=A0A8X6TTJ1_NEPPI|nr:hypothetical protein NPIL_652931 [Nephila pilipes]
MGFTDDFLVTVAPIAVVVVVIACCIYCCYKCCKCCNCCCQKERDIPVIIDTQVIQPLAPTVQHMPPPTDGQQNLLSHQQVPPQINNYPQSPPPQYSVGPQPYPPNIMQPPMSYYPQQPVPQMPPASGQPPYPTMNYNPLVPPHCPLPPIPTNPPPAEQALQSEALIRQPEYNPNYVPSAPPP